MDVAAFRRRYVNSKELKTADETEILRVLETGARAVDHHCNDEGSRFFYALTATRVFHGTGRDRVWIPDLLAATTVKLDEDSNGAYEVTLNSPADYWLERGGYDDLNALPKTLLRLNVLGQRSSLATLPQLIEIAGRWGFTEETETVGTTAEALDTTETEIDVTAGEGDLYEMGQTLLIDSEQFYVSSISGDKVRVTRAVNGTLAATHLTAAPVKRFVYVPEVVEATMIQAGHLWERRKAPSATRIVNPIVGSIEMNRGVDPDVAELLQPFRRQAVLV